VELNIRLFDVLRPATDEEGISLLVTLDTSVCFGPDSNINRRVSSCSIRGFDKIDNISYFVKYSSQRSILSAAASGYLSSETQISVVTMAIGSGSVVISAIG
jgi:hypothetical protein